MNKVLLSLFFSISLMLTTTPDAKRPAPQEPREIIIETPGLLFNPSRIKVAPGELVKITLKNTDEMSHDFVITQPNQRERVVALALAMASNPNETNFIPVTPLILNSIPMLKPGEEKSITFKAPTREGVYPYVCTYPGHGTIMYGAMYVTSVPLPPQELDLNIPESRRNPGGAMAGHEGHNMGGSAAASKTVTIYRAFMPESGPAGIAVGMPGGLSYNWDAGACRFRYAWSGGFVNLDKHWTGNGKAKADIIGTVFYRENTTAPIRIGTKESTPQQKFKGYSLLNGYPTFKYTLDGVNVTERITPNAKSNGFVRVITFDNMKKPIWFLADAAAKKPVATGGKWSGNYLAVTPVQGKGRITLTFTK
jgi:azurin